MPLIFFFTGIYLFRLRLLLDLFRPIDGYRALTAARTRAFCAAVPCCATLDRAFRAWDRSWIGYFRDFGNTNALAGSRRRPAADSLAITQFRVPGSPPCGRRVPSAPASAGAG